MTHTLQLDGHRVAFDESCPAAAPAILLIHGAGHDRGVWQAVAAGSAAAAEDYNVDIYFDGPASETEIDAQVNMVKNELAKNPKAMADSVFSRSRRV